MNNHVDSYCGDTPESNSYMEHSIKKNQAQLAQSFKEVVALIKQLGPDGYKALSDQIKAEAETTRALITDPNKRFDMLDAAVVTINQRFDNLDAAVAALKPVP